MKKTVFYLLTIVCLASCSDKTAFTLTGEVKGAKEGAKVYLFEDIWQKQIVDSAAVTDGKFYFEGKVLDPFIRYIKIEGVNIEYGDLLSATDLEIKNNPYSLLVIEPGDIRLSIDEKGRVKYSGSPLNEKHLNFWTSRINKSEQGHESLLHFIKDNKENVLGEHYFCRSLDFYPFEFIQLRELYSLFGDRLLEKKEAQRIIKYIDKLDNNAPIGTKFIEIEAENPKGGKIILSDYVGKGKVVLIDFWSSQCPPCIKEMPLLVDAYAKYKDYGFEIVSVSMDKQKDNWLKAVESLNMSWTQMSELKGWKSESYIAYGVPSIPFLVLLDKEGNIISKGFKAYMLEEKLEKILNE